MLILLGIFDSSYSIKLYRNFAKPELIEYFRLNIVNRIMKVIRQL